MLLYRELAGDRRRLGETIASRISSLASAWRLVFVQGWHHRQRAAMKTSTRDIIIGGHSSNETAVEGEGVERGREGA